MNLNDFTCGDTRALKCDTIVKETTKSFIAFCYFFKNTRFINPSLKKVIINHGKQY